MEIKAVTMTSDDMQAVRLNVLDCIFFSNPVLIKLPRKQAKIRNYCTSRKGFGRKLCHMISVSFAGKAAHFTTPSKR